MKRRMIAEVGRAAGVLHCATEWGLDDIATLVIPNVEDALVDGQNAVSHFCRATRGLLSYQEAMLFLPLILSRPVCSWPRYFRSRLALWLTDVAMIRDGVL